MSSSRDDDERSSGYGRPPKHSQFKPGQSGNPKGRPRRANILSAVPSASEADKVFVEEMFRPISVIEDGKRRKMSALQAIFRRMAQMGIKGDAATINLILKNLPRALASPALQCARSVAVEMPSDPNEATSVYQAMMDAGRG